MSKIIESLEASKKESLAYITSKQIPENDVEDVYQEAIVELLSYYKDTDVKEEQFKLFSLAVNSQVSKYFKARGKVAGRSTELLVEDVGLTFEQLYEDQLQFSQSPLDILIEDERLRQPYEELIERYVTNDTHKTFLNLVYVDKVDMAKAQAALGMTTPARYNLVMRFLEAVREGECG